MKTFRLLLCRFLLVAWAAPAPGQIDSQTVIPGSSLPLTLSSTADAASLLSTGAASRAQVLIGRTVATVLRVRGSNVNVLVPVVPAGPTTVLFREPKGKETVLGQITVAPAPTLRLIVSLKTNALSKTNLFQVLDAKPTGGESSAPAEVGEPRLSYDVFNGNGALVLSGSIVHPLQGRREVFDDPAKGIYTIRRTAPTQATPNQEIVFGIKIPNIPGGGTIRFYEAAAGVDLTDDAKGRTNRTFIGSMTFK